MHEYIVNYLVNGVVYDAAGIKMTILSEKYQTTTLKTGNPQPWIMQGKSTHSVGFCISFCENEGVPFAQK